MPVSTITPVAPGPTMVAPGRVLSVDLLRGITIALMILVNDPGDWAHVFKQLDHAEWNGCTLTDLVFPTFLFLIGASVVFSLGARAERGDCKWTQLGRIVSRAAKIFALDLLLAYFPRMHWTHMRFYGVLTRIALCYLLGGLVLLQTRKVKVLLAIIGVLLLGYWVLLRWVPVPEFGMPVRNVPLLDPVGNLTAWVDRCVVAFTQKWLHTGRLYKKTSDPEGLISTLPAVASVLLGGVAGIWLRSAGLAIQALRRVQRKLALWGVAGIAAGLVWGHWFPPNKNLWTSSYVLLSAGWAALILAACSLLVDGREQPWPKWLRGITWPWFVFGSNAIAAFTFSIVLVETLIYVKLTDADGDRHSLLELGYENIFARHVSNEWTSLAFALCFVAVCFVPVWLLWRKRIFLKI